MRSPQLGAATVSSEVIAHQSTIPKPGAPKAPASSAPDKGTALKNRIKDSFNFLSEWDFFWEFLWLEFPQNLFIFFPR